jgi:transposase-like protein
MSLTLTQVSKLTEEEARETLERIRWPNGPVCPHCGATEEHATKLQGKAHRAGLYKCRACGDQFSATINTIFEDSHLPIRTWLMAFTLLCSAKKGISALQLQRQLELGSYHTARFLSMRIRAAMQKEPLASLLKGTVEADETYVGGKPRPGGEKSKKGRGTKKTAVALVVERDGRSHARKIDGATSKELGPFLRTTVDRGATLMTDEWRGYLTVGKEFAGGHHRVSHGKGEYARGEAHVNTAESWFALLKRGITGSFHHISPQYVDWYCTEFAFRWDYRHVSDSDRTVAALKGAEGRRLTYKQPLLSNDKGRG